MKRTAAAKKPRRLTQREIKALVRQAKRDLVRAKTDEQSTRAEAQFRRLVKHSDVRVQAEATIALMEIMWGPPKRSKRVPVQGKR
jgi:hypothetical protein